jgi:hypothetical protein
MENETIVKIKCKKETLNKIFTRAKPFVNELALKINKTGVETRIVDNSHVTLYECVMGKEKFDSYEVTKETVIGIDLKKINIPMSLVLEEMELEYLPNENKIRINNYKHGILDTTGMPETKIPNIEHLVEIKTDKVDMIKRLISVSGKISDNVEFYVGEDKKLFIRGKGDTDEFAEPIGEVTELQDTRYPVMAKFSIDVLLDVLKDIKGEISISLGMDRPMKIIEEEKNEKHLFMIAPRIDV